MSTLPEGAPGVYNAKAVTRSSGNRRPAHWCWRIKSLYMREALERSMLAQFERFLETAP
jgi:hypothetical protein